MASSDTEFVLITEYFHPDTASTGQLMTDLAVGLQERGLDMTVLTGQPNYHGSENKKQPRVSLHENVLVKRIVAPQLQQSSLAKRLFNWLAFTLCTFIKLLLSRPQCDRHIIFVSNPPLLPPIIWLISRLHGWSYTYIVYDLYPDMAIESGYIDSGGIIDRIWSYLNRFVFNNAANIVVLGPAMRERVLDTIDSNDPDPETINIIHNWEDGDFIQPMKKENNWFSKKHNLVDDFVVSYSGNIGENHDLETLIRAATEFTDSNVTFIIIGEGDRKDEIVTLAENLSVRGDTVRFFAYQDLKDLPYTLTCGDVSVVSVSEGMKGICVSSKLYSSLAVGQPILVISEPDDDEARIVSSYNAGKNVTQGDVDGVVEAIETWRADLDLVIQQGENARQAFEEHFTKEQKVDEYYRILNNYCDGAC